MIFDCVLYAGEFDMLKARIAELEKVVDYFVVVEATHDHQGRPKTVWSIKMATEPEHPLRVVLGDRLIVHHVRDLPEPGGNRGGAHSDYYQVRERHHRDSILRALLGHAEPDDLVLVSDVDEIPTKQSVIQLEQELPPGSDEWACLLQDMRVWNLGWKYPGAWYGTTAARFQACRPQAMRDARSTNLHRMNQHTFEGGWHFSWFGGVEAAVAKLQSFSHYELIDLAEPQLIRDRISAGFDINGTSLVSVSVGDDPDLPLHIKRLLS